MTLLECIIFSELKLRQITYVQDYRPRSLISPISFSIGVDMDNSFANR